MGFLVFALVVVAGLAVGGYFLFRAKGGAPPRAAPESRAAPARAPAPVAMPILVHPPPGAAAGPAAPTTPPELVGWDFARADDLNPEQARAYVATFRNIPRPPRLLHHLLSPDFVGDASSAQLVDLIVMEPLICAKVLTAVNSPYFGLSTPVGSIQQAVTYLGLDTVRMICLRYILMASFQADSEARARVMDRLWAASALAAAVAERWARELFFDDRAALVSSVTLSFLGRVATVATLPKALLLTLPEGDCLARTQWEQATLGLASSEIGRLLMREWGLPENLVADASDIDRILVTPAPLTEDEQHCRLAMAYLCARLGERLAADPGFDLATLDLQAETAPELHHLRSHLGQPRLARLPALAQSADLMRALTKMRAVSPASAPSAV